VSPDPGLVKNRVEGNENILVGWMLKHWPGQLQLLNPNSSYLENADLLIAVVFITLTYPDFHKR